MNREKLHSFLWMYDQYVAVMNNIRAEDEDWNMFTLSMEDYYKEVKDKL